MNTDKPTPVAVVSTHKQPLSKLALVSLIVAALGIFAPIAWDYYKTKTELTMRIASKLPLFANDSSLEKLRIFYGSNEVKQITRFNFIFENTGKTPIQERDVVVPPQLRLENDCAFIEKSIDNLEPQSITAKTTLTSSNKILQLQFPLVNPSDKIIFSGLVSGSNPIVSFQSRIVGVHEVRFIDETISPKGHSWFPSQIRPNLVIGAIVGLLLILKRVRVESRQAQTAILVIDGDIEKLSKYTKKSDFLNYVRGKLTPLILRIDRNEILSKIESLVFEEGVTQELKPQVIQAIRTPIQDTIRLNNTASKIILGCIVAGLIAGIYFLF